MTHKVYDLAVKTGTYTTRDGQEKGRWKNIGSVLQMDDGGKVILIDRTFSPAGVPNPENRDTVMVSMFEPKERDTQQQPAQQQAPAPAPRAQGGFDDSDVPFAAYMRGSVA
jgi:single-stranded DNA-binding protein